MELPVEGVTFPQVAVMAVLAQSVVKVLLPGAGSVFEIFLVSELDVPGF